MQQEDQTREFLSRVIPWPGSKTEPGWVNIHWKSAGINAPDKEYWGGKPVKTLDDFMWWIGWTKKRPGIKDVYFCTSLQSQIAKNTKGSAKVMRAKELAISLKAIWLDVDVKEPPKGYATLEDAVSAVLEFVKTAELPAPSALIATGGGLHVYWISKDPILSREWQPYAEGLKALAIKHNLRCDAGLTTDCARILRVPGTFNHKQEPLRPVRVLGLRPKEHDYDFSTTLSFLASLVPVPVSSTAPISFIEGPQERATAFASLPSESLAQGIEREEMSPLDITPIVKGCAFIREALKTNGKDYSQPMWNLTTLAATFMEKGHALAHKMGSGHPGYTRESTEALWERKNRERKDRGLGWPSCAAIQASGCGACATCPHFAAGKSPLNLSVPIQPKAEPFSSLTLPDVDDVPIDLPQGFVLNEEGLICKVEELKGKKGEPTTTTITPIFHTTITKPWVQDHPKALNFVTSTDKGHSNPVSIPLEMLINGTEMWKVLQKQGVIPIPKNRSDCEGFLMAFLSKLQNAKSAASTLPFGWWHGEDGKKHGFVYGGTVMKDDNTETPAGFGDVKVREIYKPIGNVQPWLRACKMITDQKRPELDAIIAAAFAAPLMTVTGEYSGLLSAWGASGAGKSTAVKVGQAVWGHPKKAKEVAMSTARSVVHKMGEIKNLPVYWDEIKDTKTQQNVFDVFFTGTEGVGPSRLTSSIELRDRGDWQTMLVICSNLNFVDYVVQNQPTTDAGMYRVFEYETKDPDLNGPGRLEPMEASRITQELEHNYGVMGMIYAKTLGSDPAAIDSFTREIVSKFGGEVNQQQPERFWTAICGTLLAGAKLANMLGAEIDYAALHDFLVVEYMKNRARRISEGTAGGSVSNTQEALTSFLRAHMGEQLYTDTFPQGKGKPPAISVIFGPPLTANKGIMIQWAVKDRLCRISRSAFTAYLTARNIPPASIFRGLKEHFAATVKSAKLGANTNYRLTQENLIYIPIPEGSPLEDQLFAHTPNVNGPVEEGTLLPETSQQMPQAAQAR